MNSRKTDENPSNVNVPRGYVLAPEPRSKNLHLTVSPSLLEDLDQYVRISGKSRNEVINQSIESFLAEHLD